MARDLVDITSFYEHAAKGKGPQFMPGMYRVTEERAADSSALDDACDEHTRLEIERSFDFGSADG